MILKLGETINNDGLNSTERLSSLKKEFNINNSNKVSVDNVILPPKEKKSDKDASQLIKKEDPFSLNVLKKTIANQKLTDEER